MRIVHRFAVRLALAGVLMVLTAPEVSAQDSAFAKATADKAAFAEATAGVQVVRTTALDAAPTDTLRSASMRPRALMPLYGSLIALQALDIHSTYSALSNPGVAEANPFMKPVVGNKAVFTLAKAGSTAAALWVSEKMWKRNRKAAVIFTTAANIGMACVVANNYRIARQMK